MEDFDLEIRGHRLRARRLRASAENDMKRPVLVFLHEGLGCIDAWGDFPAAIARRWGADALVYDRLGHGRSDPLPSPGADPEYQNREASLMLPEILDRCGIESCLFIGHSDGGTIALMYAAKHGQRVAGIVTEAAHVFVDDLTLQGIRQTVQAFRRSDLRNRLLKYHGDNLDALFWRWANTWLADSFRTWSIEESLPAVQCPVLAIQGEQDEYGTPDQALSIASKVGGVGEVCFVPNCRHIPHHQARRVVLGRISQFLDEWCPPEG